MVGLAWRAEPSTESPCVLAVECAFARMRSGVRHRRRYLVPDKKSAATIAAFTIDPSDHPAGGRATTRLGHDRRRFDQLSRDIRAEAKSEGNRVGQRERRQFGAQQRGSAAIGERRRHQTRPQQSGVGATRIQCEAPCRVREGQALLGEHAGMSNGRQRRRATSEATAACLAAASSSTELSWAPARVIVGRPRGFHRQGGPSARAYCDAAVRSGLSCASRTVRVACST